LIPLKKEAHMAYMGYSKAGAMRFFASLDPSGGSLQIGFA
jgi:hypothetical protein